ncbi:hypothetical protein PIB30_080277, partial [Stylosanthes scabra]|nr:hypothetical protein [Stylosanthes scabra]
MDSGESSGSGKTLTALTLSDQYRRVQRRMQPQLPFPPVQIIPSLPITTHISLSLRTKRQQPLPATAASMDGAGKLDSDVTNHGGGEPMAG